MKFRYLLIIPIIALTLGSCTREYTCQCWISYTGKPGLPDSVLHEYTVRDTKSNAKSLCEGNSFTHDENGVHTEEACTLY